ncbi:TIR domain-containing protein [Marinobacter nauticus]|uniref:TIR domain-containing protein n=1 Tax=Marinobacter nauticus TaxID=2743 RepID=UPI001C9A0D58|nr:TIR domain-containing protein [Marinobacter nauticus]MBY5936391.1 TIR domain-containing protein [Marinobacter nauticus]MBY5953620.1 TIR domain-containing protein [Marinobacter nauticus]MBY6007413.1 TIR domain-containing protein [Marinobacter nauticus]
MSYSKPINIFISYSWDSLEHREWVEKLAKDLDEYRELHVTWDGFDLDSGVDLNYFMEKNISSSDYICVVTTEKYKKKADLREGGVGIETFLSAAIHWEDMEKSGKSRLVAIQREENSLPSYLKGRFYKDFSDDASYQKTLDSLVKFFGGIDKVKRPKKIKSIHSEPQGNFSFTKLEELVKLNSSKRECIVGSSEGTDFSGGNKIKFEIWKTYTPSPNYIVGLADNITISKTLARVVDMLQGCEAMATITVLRPRLRGNDQRETKDFFQSKGINNQVYEYTYKNYIWEFCIGDELRDLSMPDGIPNYTDQPLVDVKYDETRPSALDTMIDRVTSDYGGCAHMVFASGGMGKTSLCISLAKKLYNRSDLNRSVIFLQADAIKRYVAERGMVFQEISSLYQLYDIYTKYQGVENSLTKTAFELAVLCGNVVVVIDGLDEIDGVFEDGFSLDGFFLSLKEIYSQMGESKVIITSRDSALISEDSLAEYGIDQYKLLGFDEKSCERYVKARFKGYVNSESLVEKAIAKISSINDISDEAGRIVPFFADVVANVMEEEISSGADEPDLEIFSSETPYKSNNDVIDHLIYSILRRERVRQEIDLDEVEVVDFFGEMVSEFGKRWKVSEMRERLQLLYDDRASVLVRKFSRSPLVKDWGDNIELRYSFLESYFSVIHVLAGIYRSSTIRAFTIPLARLSVDGGEFSDILRHFSGRQDELVGLIKPIVQFLAVELDREESSAAEIEYYKKAIALLLNLAVFSGTPKRTQATKVIKSLYSVNPEEGGLIKCLYIRGDFPDLDFGNLTISNSGFENYRKFLSGRFYNTKFMYSVFKGCANNSIKNTDVDESMFDSTCELGDLKESLDIAVDRKRFEERKLEEEIRKFLGSFYRGAAFRDNNLAHIRFSNHFKMLSKKGFNSLVGAGFISLKEKKEVDNFYQVSQGFRESVRKFLNEGYADQHIKKFIAFVAGE